MQPDREAGLDQGLQVDPPPAHHAVPVRVRPPLDGGRQLGLLLGREPRLAPRPGPVVQAGEALGVVAVHPVAQGLPVHAGRPRRLLARGPSSTSARASIRRAALASRHRAASRRSSPAPGSCRVIATVIAPPVSASTPPINRGRRHEAPGATTRQEFGPLVLEPVAKHCSHLPQEVLTAPAPSRDVAIARVEAQPPRQGRQPGRVVALVRVPWTRGSEEHARPRARLRRYATPCRSARSGEDHDRRPEQQLSHGHLTVTDHRLQERDLSGRCANSRLLYQRPRIADASSRSEPRGA